jgi:photosystem II stability/assembly factor-like uncharacterized protein
VKTTPLDAVKVTVAAIAVLGTTALLFFGAFNEEQAPIEGKPIPVEQDLLDVSVIDATRVWAVGHVGRILHSDDSGNTWTFQASGIATALAAVAFRTADLGVAVGYDGVILRTTDGGKTWKPVPSGVDLYLTSLHLGPGSRIFAAGEFGTILVSEDDGAAWRVVTTEQYDFIINGIDFSPNGVGWAVGELGKALWSGDGGNTWSPRDLGERLIANEMTLFSVEVVSDSEIWASGIENVLVHSSDGGQTWQELAAPCSSKTQLLRIRFAGPRGYVTGRRCVAFTADNGRTWQPSSLGSEVRYSWLYGISVTPTDTWAAGYREGLFRAGATDQWERIAIDRANERGPSEYGAKRIPVEAARADAASPERPPGAA